MILAATCVLIIATYLMMIDRKGISTDEGMRMAIINGGQQYEPSGVSPDATWPNVLETNSANAYQPLYFLIQNTLMRLTGRQNDLFFRSVNVGFLALCLAGLITLSNRWPTTSRLFLLGLFSFNAFLFMHVLQIREYIVGLAFYIWSTWFVLRLQVHRFDRPWPDIAWFGSYGVLLSLGFFTQSWVVFPSVAQGLFLLVRRNGDRLRYYVHLALAYTVVLCATLPYLRTHQQKVNVGLWATDQDSIWPHLSVGFHLLLSGHAPGTSAFTEFLFWFWLAAAVVAAVLVLRPRTATPPGGATADARRQGGLMILCMGAALAFQIGYALKIENLSLWPRYFVIHYFFLTWLIALGFATVDEARRAATAPLALRRRLTLALSALAVLLAGSAVFQTRSYWRDPYLDTGVSRGDDWRTVAAEVARLLQPTDVAMTPDYIIRGTLTFTHPLANRVICLSELAQAELAATPRLVYLEPKRLAAQRDSLLAQLGDAGFRRLQVIDLPVTGGGGVISEWKVVVFTRD